MTRARDDRKKNSRYAFFLEKNSAAGKCPKCGNNGPHFVPPSLGDPGFFTCEEYK